MALQICQLMRDILLSYKFYLTRYIIYQGVKILNTIPNETKNFRLINSK